MNKLILIDFTFSNNKGTSIHGQSLFPYVNDVVWMPVQTIILSGTVDDHFKTLTGKNGADFRTMKNRIIKESCVASGTPNVYKVVKPFLINESHGVVKLPGYLSGYSANNSSNITITKGPKNLVGKKIPELFQNAKDSKVKLGEIITLEEVYKINKKYFDQLVSLIGANINTCSSKTITLK